MPLVNAVINSLVSGLVGVIGFVVLREVVNGQDTSTFSAAQRTLLDIIPLVLAILVVVGMFFGLSRLRGNQ
jgi:hypothetical protein